MHYAVTRMNPCSFTNCSSLTHSLTHSPTHSLTHSLAHSLTSGLSNSLTLLPAKRRILLSGTPMQNELTEFYNMVHSLTHSLSYSLTHSLTHSGWLLQPDGARDNFWIPKKIWATYTTCQRDGGQSRWQDQGRCIAKRAFHDSEWVHIEAREYIERQISSRQIGPVRVLQDITIAGVVIWAYLK